MVAALFANLQIAVDGNNYSEKQKISNLVKDHGATIPLVVNNEVESINLFIIKKIS